MDYLIAIALHLGLYMYMAGVPIVGAHTGLMIGAFMAFVLGMVYWPIGVVSILITVWVYACCVNGMKERSVAQRIIDEKGERRRQKADRRIKKYG